MAFFSLKSYQNSYPDIKKPCNLLENRALKDNPKKIGTSGAERLFVENLDKKYLEAAMILLKAVSEHSHGVAKKSLYSNNREFFESVNKLLSKADKKSDS